jgi:hypothetical protein
MFWEKADAWTKDAPALRAQPTILYPGESKDLNLASTDDEVTKAWLKAGDVEFGATERTADEVNADLAALKDDELRAYIADRGGKTDGRWSRDRLLEEARALPAGK